MVLILDLFAGSPTLGAGMIFILVVYPLLWLARWTTAPDNFPPGPPRLPLLGNILNMPHEKPYLQFTVSYSSSNSQLNTSTYSLFIEMAQAIRRPHRSQSRPFQHHYPQQSRACPKAHRQPWHHLFWPSHLPRNTPFPFSGPGLPANLLSE